MCKGACLVRTTHSGCKQQAQRHQIWSLHFTWTSCLLMRMVGPLQRSGAFRSSTWLPLNPPTLRSSGCCLSSEGNSVLKAQLQQLRRMFIKMGVCEYNISVNVQLTVCSDPSANPSQFQLRVCVFYIDGINDGHYSTQALQSIAVPEAAIGRVGDAWRSELP